MMIKKLTYSVLLLIAINFLIPTSVAAKEKTTVFGLYYEWQTDGYPNGIVSTYYDYGNEKLNVIIEDGMQDIENEIKERVMDLENIEFETATQVDQDNTEPNSSKRWKGVLAVTGAYGVCVLVLISFLFFRNKKGEQHVQNDKDKMSEIIEFYNKNLGGK